jgi:hypothetical protein
MFTVLVRKGSLALQWQIVPFEAGGWKASERAAKKGS